MLHGDTDEWQAGPVKYFPVNVARLYMWEGELSMVLLIFLVVAGHVVDDYEAELGGENEEAVGLRMLTTLPTKEC